MYPTNYYNGGVQEHLHRGFICYLENCRLVFKRENKLRKKNIKKDEVDTYLSVAI